MILMQLVALKDATAERPRTIDRIEIRRFNYRGLFASREGRRLYNLDFHYRGLAFGNHVFFCRLSNTAGASSTPEQNQAAEEPQRGSRIPSQKSFWSPVSSSFCVVTMRQLKLQLTARFSRHSSVCT